MKFTAALVLVVVASSSLLAVSAMAPRQLTVSTPQKTFKFLVQCRLALDKWSISTLPRYEPYLPKFVPESKRNPDGTTTNACFEGKGPLEDIDRIEKWYPGAKFLSAESLYDVRSGIGGNADIYTRYRLWYMELPLPADEEPSDTRSTCRGLGKWWRGRSNC